MHEITDNRLLSEISSHPTMRITFHNLDKPTRRVVLDEINFEIADLESFNFKVFKRVVGRVKRRTKSAEVSR